VRKFDKIRKLCQVRLGIFAMVLCKVRKVIEPIRLDIQGGWHLGRFPASRLGGSFVILHPMSCATGSFCRSPAPVCQAAAPLAATEKTGIRAVPVWRQAAFRAINMVKGE
jgi:hypothetical protein